MKRFYAVVASAAPGRAPRWVGFCLSFGLVIAGAALFLAGAVGNEAALLAVLVGVTEMLIILAIAARRGRLQ